LVVLHGIVVSVVFVVNIAIAATVSSNSQMANLFIQILPISTRNLQNSKEAARRKSTQTVLYWRIDFSVNGPGL
jgi:hypothetical protein